MPYGSTEDTLRKAAELIRAGANDEARQLLRDILVASHDNLEAWELLAYASRDLQEEIHCLDHILSLRPDHPWAEQRLAEINAAHPSGQAPPERGHPRSKQAAQPGKRHPRLAPIPLGLAILLGVLALGFVIFRFGFQPSTPAAQQTMTSAAVNTARCQEVIARALEASDNYCDQFGSNNVCYGNETLLAELIPEASERFTERGDIVGVEYLHRLSVSPLNLDTEEWGIAIFKVMANLPRSLPGEMVTLMVFGNTAIDNESQNLETFYFTSGIGELVCEEVPYDGILVSMPDGTGIRFKVNNADLTLMGNAGLSAVKNGKMDIKLFSGSGQITSMGQTQNFGAGQQVSISLGGSSGAEAVSIPSTPAPLSPEDLTLACTLTDEYCAGETIQPLSDEAVELTLEAGFQVTNTRQPTPTSSQTPPATATPTRILMRTFTRTRTHPHEPTYTFTPTCTATPTETFTPTHTDENTHTPTFTLDPACPITAGSLGSPDPQRLSLSITNHGASNAVISGIYIVWFESLNQRLGEVRLDANKITNTDDTTSPTTIPDEIAWFGSVDDRAIPAGSTMSMTIFFPHDLEPTGYDVTVSFGPGCQVQGSR